MSNNNNYYQNTQNIGNYNNNNNKFLNNTYNNNNNNNNNNNFNKNQNTKTNLDTFSNEFSENGEPILVYDSFDDDSDDEINNKNKSKAKNKLKKIRQIFHIIRKNDKKVENTQEKQQQQQQEIMQQSDQYGIVPRVGPKTKTIIIQDEQGKELSRIVSSTRDRPNLQFDPQQQQQQFIQQPTYSIPPNALNSIVIPQNQLQSLVYQPQATTPIFLPQQSFYSDSNSYYQQPYFSQSRLSVNKDVIIEEDDSRSIARKPSSYKKLSTRGKVADSSQFLKRNSKIQKESYIFCCEFCDRPSTDTCQCCWKICACPTWWALLISLFAFLSIGGLVTVIVLIKLGKI